MTLLAFSLIVVVGWLINLLFLAYALWNTGGQFDLKTVDKRIALLAIPYMVIPLTIFLIVKVKGE